MKIQKWLTINNKGSARITKSKPGVQWNEISMLLNIELPDSVFKRPVITANIKIDGELNHEFNYEEQKKIEDVLETLPNIHLLNVNVMSKDDKGDE